MYDNEEQKSHPVAKTESPTFINKKRWQNKKSLKDAFFKKINKKTFQPLCCK